MAVIQMPRFLGGARRPKVEPAPDWDHEMYALQGIGEHLASIPTKEGQFRALTYWMWRLKSGDRPNVEDWVDSIAEQSAVKLAGETGFKGGVE